ncbi:alpha-1,3-glucanase/mutanase, putative [Talaromyces stipitatus ATCC 10500]|uniref:Alpha-1,3-glucanase/mutanase, putative n=1 Tax=Talaromyces stipitatus (strain ATCC 10500 / CBS 375.48 / QM 6759 / NRRL 1006) TaxID=441959 RepID=B8M8A4_TALSN|nr:alpha-1,3-glucanase/mutanase, putative [Talaromyces stipitatus ATCC 10500]EED20417.1 alpha-1,3-glucanase/mutanase, putative [Talaromyces stipitatus ATCC 10500]
MVKTFFLAALSAMSTLVQGRPGQERFLSERQSTDKLVFAHFMIGIVSDRHSAADYDADMQRAKSYGIDAFALNIGVDPYTDEQLGYAFDSAANNGMKVFISFDFNWWSTSQATAIGQKIAQYASKPAQLKVDNKVFVSSFAGDGVDIATMRSAAGIDLFFAPNFHPSYGTDLSNVDGLLNWMAWPNNGNNKAPTSGSNVTVEQGDQEYVSALAGKAYIAPASPWFSTHFGPEVSYSKNWVFPSDLLWYNRWKDLLTLGPRFIEIVTWNDYGESHYIGPLDSPHTDDGASKWVNDMPHDGWLDLAKPFIAAFKAGATAVDNYITSDELIYWYRPTPKDVNCDATDTCMDTSASNSSGNYFIGRPNGYETMQDSVFVVSLFTAAAEITVSSGGNTQTFQASAGANAFQVPMGVGQQTFSVTRNGQTVFQGTSLKQIINGCVCGLYNFNAYVGTLPAGFNDPLQPDGLASLVQGLHVSTCAATPSLGTAPPVITTTSTSAPVITTSTTTTSSTKTTSTTTKPTTTTTTTTTSKTSTTTQPSTTEVCIAGTGPGNYVGLCSFCCNYGYCPPGPCTCTQSGAPVPTPPVTGTVGVPLANEDDSYLGLCSFACNHGYCPDTACRVV